MLPLIFFFTSAVYASSAVTFPTMNVKVGEHILKVEVAQTEDQLQRGLMYRTELKQGHGMLFIFEKQETRHFWMKNTFIPLAIGFFDRNKVLVDIQEMQPVKSEMQTDIPQYESRKPAIYVLEVPTGWFKSKKIKEGAKLEFQGKVPSPTGPSSR